MSDYMKKQARFEFKRDPANDMLLGPDGCHYDTEAEAMYHGQLGFCGCGDPEGVHAFLCDCLAAFDRDKFGFKPGTGLDKITELVVADPDSAAYFIAYVLDKSNLTEHGSSIGGSWLTARGAQFLEIGPFTIKEAGDVETD